MALSPAQRKRDQRKRDAAHLAAVEATTFTMPIYRGTTAALEQIKQAGKFEQDAEAVTTVLHRVAELAACDKSLFNKLISLNNLQAEGVAE